MDVTLPQDFGLFLDPEAVIYCSSRGVEFHSSDVHVQLDDWGYYDLVLSLRPYLDGAYSLQEICEASPAAAQGAVHSLLQWMIQRGFVRPVPRGAELQSVDAELDCWFMTGRKTATVKTNLSQSRAFVRGHGPLVLAIAHCLISLEAGHVTVDHPMTKRFAAYGCGKTHLEVSPEAMFRPAATDAVFVAFDGLDDLRRRLENYDNAAFKIYMLGAIGAYGFMGPIPAGCRLCAMRAALRIIPMGQARDEPLSSVAAGLLAQQAVLTFVRDEMGLPHGLPGAAIMTIDLATLAPAIVVYGDATKPTCDCRG